jgi:hypothetical protein
MATKQMAFVPHMMFHTDDYNHTHHHRQISNEDKFPAIALIIIVPLIVWIIFKQQDK